MVTIFGILMSGCERLAVERMVVKTLFCSLFRVDADKYPNVPDDTIILESGTILAFFSANAV